MKIYVDDVRPRPEGFNVLVHSVNEAIRIIEDCERKGEPIELLSLDHDLGEFAPDGGDAICLLDYLAEHEKFYPIVFHTANPIGRANMQRIIDRFWP